MCIDMIRTKQNCIRFSETYAVNPPSRLTLFSLLFAWANILHQLSYPEWIKELHMIGWLVFLASVALALHPSSIILFVATLLLRFIYTVYWTPMIRGHLFLEGLFTLGIIIAFIPSLLRLRKTRFFSVDEEESLYESFAPLLCFTCLVTYGAVTISKLNSEFLDPQKSAAVQLLFWSAEWYSFIPTGKWAQQISIWGTLVFEGGIPILLCFRRTRWLGLACALFFHTLLGFLPLRISSFTLTMCLLLFAWVPKESAARIHQLFLDCARALRITPFQFAMTLSLAAGGTGLLYAARNGINLDMHALDLGMGIWWWQTVIMFAALWAIRGLQHRSALQLLDIRTWPLRFYALFVFFNCLCPYIGLKTRSTLTMHCNLKTEKGYWNHLFLPEKMRVFKYQDNLVHILASDLPDFVHLKKDGLPLPFFEFRRWCRLAEGDFYVEYRDDSGEKRYFRKRNGNGSDPNLMQGYPILEKFLCFNPAGASHDYIPELAARTGSPRNVVPDFDVPK